MSVSLDSMGETLALASGNRKASMPMTHNDTNTWQS